MSRSPDISFVTFAPGTERPDITKQAFSLMDENVWGGDATHRARTDSKCSQQIAAAVSSTGEVIAAGTLEFLPPDYFCIAEIATTPDFQQLHGLGSALLSMLEDTAKSFGGCEISLSALPDSRTFFEKHGYIPDPAPNISTLAMMKLL